MCVLWSHSQRHHGIAYYQHDSDLNRRSDHRVSVDAFNLSKLDTSAHGKVVIRLSRPRLDRFCPLIRRISNTDLDPWVFPTKCEQRPTKQLSMVRPDHLEILGFYRYYAAGAMLTISPCITCTLAASRRPGCPFLSFSTLR